MNKKIVVQFVILTFIIRLIFGGGVAVFAVETSAYNYLFVVALFIALYSFNGGGFRPE